MARRIKDKHELRKSVATKQNDKKRAIINDATEEEQRLLRHGMATVCYRTGRILRL